MEWHWQEEHEDLLRIWLTQAYFDRMMHSHAAVFYTKLYHIGGMISVCLAAITTAGVFFQFSASWGNTVWGFVVVTLLSLSASVTSAAMHFLNPQQIAQDHTKAEILYNDFIVDLNSVLVYGPRNREPCKTVMERAKIKLQLLPHATPTIPTHISRLYVKKTPRKRPTLQEIVVGHDESPDSHLGMQEQVLQAEQLDIESSLVREAQQTGNSELFKFLREKSNILDTQTESDT